MTGDLRRCMETSMPRNGKARQRKVVNVLRPYCRAIRVAVWNHFFLWLCLFSVIRICRIDTDVPSHGINNNDDDEASVAACLLVMDDNHFLIEWIAYHYHAAGLRRLVIAVDPKSSTSPLQILGRWKDKINITAWTSDDDYINKNKDLPNEFDLAEKMASREFKGMSLELVERRARQRLFYKHCMLFLKQEEKEEPSLSLRSKSTPTVTPKPLWTMFVDVDEFVRVNYLEPDSVELLIRSDGNFEIEPDCRFHAWREDLVDDLAL